MLTKSEKLWIKSLRDVTERKGRGQFVAEGTKLVLELIECQNSELDSLFASKTWLVKHGSRLEHKNGTIRELEENYFKDISTLKSPDPVLGVFKLPRSGEEMPQSDDFILYLDRIRDPGNLGTIIRSADWFGVRNIFISPDSVDPFNNKCVQASMASILRVTMHQISWKSMNDYYPDRQKYAAVLNGKSLHDLDPVDVNFVCIGNESQGLSNEIIQDCNQSLSISSQLSLGAESLNAAIASSIVLAWKFVL